MSDCSRAGYCLLVAAIRDSLVRVVEGEGGRDLAVLRVSGRFQGVQGALVNLLDAIEAY